MADCEKRERPSWDEYFVNLVVDTAQRSSCMKRHVGAIIVRDKQILSTGYNGAPRNILTCYNEQKCWRNLQGIPHGTEKDLCLGSHAEANAICQAAKTGTALDGASLYVTTFPCPTCAKAVIQAGLVQVNYIAEYYGKQHDFAQWLLESANIEVRKLGVNIEDVLQRNPHLNLRLK